MLSNNFESLHLTIFHKVDQGETWDEEKKEEKEEEE